MVRVVENKTVQLIRVVDVFFLGPMMIYFGTSDKTKELPEWSRMFLTGAGVTTILYNGFRWLEVERAKNKRK